MMVNLIRKQSPARIIAFGFIFVIIAGSVLLSLPFSVRDGVDLKYTDALYTSTSAVCVTGLVVVDSYDIEWLCFTFEIVDMDGARIDKVLVQKNETDNITL